MQQSYSIRTILVASDLNEGSDEVVRCAADLAQRFGAELHLLHALDLDAPYLGRGKGEGTFSDLTGKAQAELEAQAHRAAGSAPADVVAKTMVRAPHRAIRDRAAEVGAELIVLGPHRGGEMGAHFLGTTADRVVREAEVPCLLVSGPCPASFERIGVPLDFSPPSRAALDVAVAWSGSAAGGGGTELWPFHVAAPLEREENPRAEEELFLPRLEREMEEARARAGDPPVAARSGVTWEVSPARGIAGYARQHDLSPLVMGTQGLGGMKRALIGSVATGVARQAPCPVLLVPPAVAKRAMVGAGGWEGQTRLRRVVVAVELAEGARAVTEWSMRHFAPDADQLVVHVMERPGRPFFRLGASAREEEERQRARSGATAHLIELVRSLGGGAQVTVREGKPVQEIARVAVEADADAVVLGAHEREGMLDDWLGSTAEGLLQAAPTPVLVVRNPPPAAPRSILAAVEGSDLATGVLVWARRLAERYSAPVQVVHVVDPLHGELPHLGTMEDEMERARGWVAERAAEAGLALADDAVTIADGKPADRILDAAREASAELMVIGTRGGGAAGRVLLGSVAAELLRRAPCPVLVVEDPTRMMERRAEL